MVIIHGILIFVQIVLSIVLIVLITSQTSKSEGLGGVIGGGATSNFRFKPGFEERLDNITRNFAVAWLVVCLLVAMSGHH